MPKDQAKPNKKLINQAWRNPFILGLKKHIEDQGQNFPHFLCYRIEKEEGTRCPNKDHIKGNFRFKKKLECKNQVQALLALHFQSKHLTGGRLEELLAKLEEEK